MAPEDAQAIAGWRYPEPYSIYDSDADAAFPAPALRVHAVDRDDELAGFCSFGEDGRVPGFDYDESAVDVGAGLRPDLTGRGEGADFLAAILDFARDELGLVRLRVTVADWNERALRAVRSLGFQDSACFERADGCCFRVLLLDGDGANLRPAGA